jgi:hypothetical protein
MPIKKQFPTRSVSQRRRSNSSGAPSGDTAARKSKKSSEASLKVATPTNRKLQFLKEAGIVVPEEIPSDEDHVPLDFTRLSSKGIGGIQSRYAVRHAHAIFNVARLATDEAHLKRDLRLVKAKFRLKHKGEKLNIVNAMMEDEDEIMEIEEKLLEVAMKMGVLSAVAQGYEDLRNAASREMSRRIGERAQID